jgi:hypothetical protein
VISVCVISSLKKKKNPGLGTIHLSCLVTFLAGGTALTGLELREKFYSFGLSKISLWPQVISMPSLVQIGLLIMEL